LCLIALAAIKSTGEKVQINLVGQPGGFLAFFFRANLNAFGIMIENLRMETPVNKSDQLGSRLGMCNKTATPTWFVAGEVILCGSATTRHQVEVRTALENAN